MTNLAKRKELAAKVLGVGKNRILFDSMRIAEIKEAITKQDIRDLYADGAISIKEKAGKRRKEKRKTRRGPGKIKRTVRDTKMEYVILVRKLRNYLNELRKHNKLTKEEFLDLRKKIKSGIFKNKAHLKDYIHSEIKNISAKK